MECNYYVAFTGNLAMHPCHDVKHLRQTSRTLFEALYNNPLWYAYLKQHSGCACGRCEAPWLLNGWICPVLYRPIPTPSPSSSSLTHPVTLPPTPDAPRHAVQPPKTKKCTPRWTVKAFLSPSDTAVSSSSQTARLWVLVIVRGHALRSGDRLSDNSSGEVVALELVLFSIQQRICDNTALTSVYRIRIVFDIVCKDADFDKREGIGKLIDKYMTGGHTSRISPKTLGVAQPDSLLVSCDWMASLYVNSEAPCGFFNF